MATLGELADAIYAKDQEIAAAEAVVKGLDVERRALAGKLMNLMKEQQTTITRGKHATASLGETVRPQIADFDKLAAFIKRNGALYLFERRIGVKAYNELMEQRNGKPIPGLTEFKKDSLSIRKV